MDWKSESMTVERKITSRHGVDSRPLSEWLRVLGALPRGVRCVSLRGLAKQHSWRPRRGSPVVILPAARHYGRLSRS